MIRTETREVPATEARSEEVRAGLTCDSCGKQSTQYDGWAERFDVDEITLSRKTGSSFPECGQGEKFIIDLCPECFSSKLVPWLESMNIKGRVEEWSW